MKNIELYLLLPILAENPPLNNICFALVIVVMAQYGLLRWTK